jgi:hypothetical protein
MYAYLEMFASPVSKHIAMKEFGWSVSKAQCILNLGNWQLQAPAALLSGKQLPVPIVDEAGLMWRKREKSLPLQKSDLRSPSPYALAKL